MSPQRIPVTLLTGFLGSGKTTLLNRVLTEHHGQRIAVIENEFGEVGVDDALVIDADEEVFEMNNGCICCTVRGDLIRILLALLQRRERFDRVLIETTGLADPAPVAQTFFVDAEVAAAYTLDAIVTVVDSAHIDAHLGESRECQQQIAFADVLLLNKTDLVAQPALERLQQRLRKMNHEAKLLTAVRGDVAIADILDLHAFALDRALDVQPKFLEPEWPFEWGGMLPAASKPIHLQLAPGPDDDIAVWVAQLATAEQLGPLAEAAAASWDKQAPLVQPADGLQPDRVWRRVALTGAGPWTLQVSTGPATAVFLQHHPHEFEATWRCGQETIQPTEEREFVPAHEHEDEVTSVSVLLPRPVDPLRFDQFMGHLLRTQGTDIYRSKGIVAVGRDPRRWVFQGVHMLMEMDPAGEWPDADRRGRLVFIGRRLDREALTTGVLDCLVPV